MAEKHAIIPIFVPHKGCPHDCIFCNQRKISGQTEEMTVPKMQQIIDSHLKTIKQGSKIEIAFYGGSFTGIEEEKQLAFLSAANEYVQRGKVGSVRLSTRPDYINEKILKYLKANSVAIIELGVQSLDDEVLMLSNRGHTSSDVFLAAQLIKSYGIELGIQTMTGLPGDSKAKDIETAIKVIGLEPSLVRIYPVLVIKGTCLETLMQQAIYEPQTVDEAVDICSELLSLYESHHINVIRIGLQPSENISEDSEVAAGPFHPAFRQLVESRLVMKKIEEYIIEKHLENTPSITIYTGSGNISNVAGQKQKNILEIKNKYGIKAVKIKADSDKTGEIVILPY